MLCELWSVKFLKFMLKLVLGFGRVGFVLLGYRAVVSGIEDFCFFSV